MKYSNYLHFGKYSVNPSVECAPTHHRSDLSNFDRRINQPLTSHLLPRTTIRPVGRIVTYFAAVLFGAHCLLAQDPTNRLEVVGDRLREEESRLTDNKESTLLSEDLSFQIGQGAKTTTNYNNQATGYRLQATGLKTTELPLVDFSFQIEQGAKTTTNDELPTTNCDNNQATGYRLQATGLKTTELQLEPISNLPSSSSYLGVTPKLMMNPTLEEAEKAIENLILGDAARKPSVTPSEECAPTNYRSIFNCESSSSPQLQSSTNPTAAAVSPASI